MATDREAATDFTGSNNALKPTALLCAVSGLAVFLLDQVTPIGVADSVLYVLVVLLALRVPRSRLVISVAALTTAFTVVGFFLSPASADPWIGVVNRSLAGLAIWTTALVGLHRRTLLLERERLLAERESLLMHALEAFIPVCAWCKRVREDDAWHSLDAYVTNKTGSLFTHGICPDCKSRAGDH